MPELSNSAIALLCEIGQFSPESASDEQKMHLSALVDGGYVRRAGERFELTAKAQRFLSERGAGLNEA